MDGIDTDEQTTDEWENLDETEFWGKAKREKDSERIKRSTK